MRLGVVTEAFADRPLAALLDWLVAAVPAVTDLEIGSGGYAPSPHCDRAALLGSEPARRRWLAEIEGRGLRVGALNAWGNPLHPDPDLARRHDADLRDTIRLAAALGVDRVVALAGCPGEPTFAAGGWLPYLEGRHERQWAERVAPYWRDIAGFAAREHPDLLLCLELHPGTAVYNVATFGELAALAPNLAANVDPSHFMWMGMDPLAVVAALGDRAGHGHAKDVTFNARALALHGLLDHRWPGDPDDMPWSFATVGHGRDAAWWAAFAAALAGTRAHTLAIEHEDPRVPPERGVVEAARLLAAAEVAA
jgi:sugar phosphate isomerase/epimerase